MRAHSDAESVPAGVYCEKSDHCAHLGFFTLINVECHLTASTSNDCKQKQASELFVDVNMQFPT